VDSFEHIELAEISSEEMLDAEEDSVQNVIDALQEHMDNACATYLWSAINLGRYKLSATTLWQDRSILKNSSATTVGNGDVCTNTGAVEELILIRSETLKQSYIDSKRAEIDRIKKGVAEIMENVDEDGWAYKWCCDILR
jgi:hypothetical protein